MKIFLLLAILSTVSLAEEDTKSTAKKSKRDVSYNTPSSSYSNSYNSDLYSPPQCSAPRACINPSAIDVVDISWMEIPRLFYITAGGCTGYTHTANILLGREVRTNQELNEMCLTYFINIDTVFIDGYWKQFCIDCMDISPPGARDCVPNADLSDQGTLTSLLNSEQCFPVYTDGFSYAVYIRCYNGKLDIIVLSTEPSLDEEAVTQVMNQAEKYQYPTKDLKFLTCDKQRYPPPFQNYLQQSGPYNPNTCYAESGSTPYQNSPAPYTEPQPASPPAQNSNYNPHTYRQQYH